MTSRFLKYAAPPPAQYEAGSAPALALEATVQKTKTRFANYGEQGLLCGKDGLPHLIVDGNLQHLGEFTARPPHRSPAAAPRPLRRTAARQKIWALTGHAGFRLQYPGIGFLYVAGWIGYAGRSYVIANKAGANPTNGEIIIDVPMAIGLMFSAGAWPLLALREAQAGTLFEKEENITVSVS